MPWFKRTSSMKEGVLKKPSFKNIRKSSIMQDMRTAIAFYSRSGNCRFVAERISKIISEAGGFAELIEIKLAKDFSSIRPLDYLLAGKSAVMKETPQLARILFYPEQFDNIILGTPIWANDMASPMRTFICENLAALQSKPVSAYVCLAGKNGTAALENIRGFAGIEKLEATLSLTNPKKHDDAETDIKIRGFCEKILSEYKITH